MRPLHTAEIYEAATDDAAFDRLAGSLGKRLGARSGVIHWRHPEDGEEVSYSGHFSAEHMEVYDLHFGEHDLWSHAIRAADARRAWDCAELVTPRDYEASRIYNDWIRPMGDDTFHCIGGRFRSGSIVAEVGFHRGRAQPAFDAAAVRVLDGYLIHIRQLVSLRHKLRAAACIEASLAAAQDAVRFGVITLAGDGRVVRCNRRAETILKRGDGLMLRGGRLHTLHAPSRGTLAGAVARAFRCEGYVDALLVPRTGGGTYELSFVSCWAGTRREVQAFVHDRQDRDPSLVARLRALYGLTAAEADVAAGLETATLAELAASRGTSVETVRSQIKAISAKLGCQRQLEIVSLIAKLPQLESANR